MDLVSANTPEELFGKNANLYGVTQTYKVLIRIVHPDVGGTVELAAKLNRFYEAARSSLLDGTYGTDKAPLTNSITVQTKRNAYKVGAVFKRGTTSSIFSCTNQDNQSCLMKVANSPKDNDLLVHEAKALKTLITTGVKFEDKFNMYFPQYTESFGYKTKGGNKTRQANVFGQLEWPLYTLEEVREEYKDGIHPKDMAWMFRRLLFSLGIAHERGVIHGAILPSHILIQPDNHGLVLVDWTHSSMEGEKIKTIEPRWKTWYPNEVMEKETPMPGTDIYMAVMSMYYLMEKIPKPLRAFFRGCSQVNVKRRPQDAFSLLGEFNDLIEEMWGPRRFRPFYM